MNSDLTAPHLDLDVIVGRFDLEILLILDTAVTAEKKFVMAPVKNVLNVSICI